MWTYLVMAVVLKIFKKNPWPIIGLIASIIFCVLVISGEPWLQRERYLALLRCLLCFSMGMVIYRFGSGGPKTGLLIGSIEELSAIIFVLAIVLREWGPITLWAPFVFAIAVWVFSREAGIFSKLLMHKTFRWFGMLSCSIYIIHVFVQARFRDVLDLADRFGMPWSIEQAANGAQRVAGPWGLADLLTIAMLGAVLVAAWLSYRLIEAPGRRWSRSIFRKSA